MMYVILNITTKKHSIIAAPRVYKVSSAYVPYMIRKRCFFISYRDNLVFLSLFTDVINDAYCRSVDPHHTSHGADYVID